jgi:hypothetical protein
MTRHPSDARQLLLEDIGRLATQLTSAINNASMAGINVEIVTADVVVLGVRRKQLLVQVLGVR